MRISELQKILAEALAHSGDVVVLYDFSHSDETARLGELTAATISSVTNPDGVEERAFVLLSDVAVEHLLPETRLQMKKAGQALVEH